MALRCMVLAVSLSTGLRQAYTIPAVAHGTEETLEVAFYEEAWVTFIVM